jgi:molecular chaperone GrpE
MKKEGSKMGKNPIVEQSEKLLEAFDFAGTMAEMEKEHEKQMRSLLLSFLEVKDSFDRFFTYVKCVKEPKPEQVANWLNTFQLIGKQLEIALRKADVIPIACIGKIFDPNIHEVMEVKETEEIEEETIIEEVRAGYEWRGKILRRPQVVVAKKPKSKEG